MTRTGDGWSLRASCDPVLLFRFSALTYNAHRIHYDAAYATGTEGYPGLVVHGPLLALLGLELPRRVRPGRRVAGLSFRARAPLFAGQHFEVTGVERGDDWAVKVTGPGGTEAMTVQVQVAHV